MGKLKYKCLVLKLPIIIIGKTLNWVNVLEFYQKKNLVITLRILKPNSDKFKKPEKEKFHV